jgi:hypothetical protein
MPDALRVSESNACLIAVRVPAVVRSGFRLQLQEGKSEGKDAAPLTVAGCTLSYGGTFHPLCILAFLCVLLHVCVLLESFVRLWDCGCDAILPRQAHVAAACLACLLLVCALPRS